MAKVEGVNSEIDEKLTMAIKIDPPDQMQVSLLLELAEKYLKSKINSQPGLKEEAIRAAEQYALIRSQLRTHAESKPTDSSIA